MDGARNENGVFAYFYTSQPIVEDQSGVPAGVDPYLSAMVWVTQPAKWTYSALCGV